ncbi:hypothetical protein [Pseudomonas sp. KU43P]|uniref:hypothetical protein n=1 Tax=Pseudomonas sp. KU43P TaxID=2487887 RepID=UPI0029539AD7|nr:hypothetical protein [Pseudomonas sp. KU43P]
MVQVLGAGRNQWRRHFDIAIGGAATEYRGLWLIKALAFLNGNRAAHVPIFFTYALHLDSRVA